MAVEAAFPQSGISRMEDVDVQSNELWMSGLEDGTLYHMEGDSGVFVSGSLGEGLAMEDRWGHPRADVDEMYLNGGLLGVYVEGGQQTRGKSCLEFHHKGCPAAYCKLEVTDLGRLRESTVSGGDKWCDDSCLEESDGKLWLNTYSAVRNMKDTVGSTRDDPAVTGPASQSPGGTYDIV